MEAREEYKIKHKIQLQLFGSHTTYINTYIRYNMNNNIIERLERIEAKLDAVIKALHEYDGNDEYGEDILNWNVDGAERIPPCVGHDKASWDDEEGLASLLASLAETNPLRYYMFESTARGFNMFHDMWTTAKRARTQKAIFCGWWRNQLYMADPKSDIYKVYWDGKLSPEEKEWTKDIKKMYNYEINSRQIAWWRWKLHEGLKES